MFDNLAARMRRSDINYRVLIPLMLSAAAVQVVVAIVRVTTSYRVVELDLPVVWLGIYFGRICGPSGIHCLVARPFHRSRS